MQPLWVENYPGCINCKPYKPSVLKDTYAIEMSKKVIDGNTSTPKKHTKKIVVYEGFGENNFFIVLVLLLLFVFSCKIIQNKIIVY